MKQNNRQTGAVYEQAAGRFLEAQGYRILESNYRCPRGEIDLIAVDGSYLVFCEVKFRKSLKTGHPFEAVDLKKQRIISKCAQYYLARHQVCDIPCRFDVIGILGKEITLAKDAFTFVR
ncbi:MAG: YraN family protein [Hespellia sp.]|nr:YraN family protein [Hespellia sp.]